MSGTGSDRSGHVVIVVGAGPAGMALAKKLTDAGHDVVILNRDIKFGGLAEYGIFPSKLKPKVTPKAHPLPNHCFDRHSAENGPNNRKAGS